MSVSLKAFNQRAVTEFGHLWNTSTDVPKPGLMQVLFKKEKCDASFGNVAYIAYPFQEYLDDSCETKSLPTDNDFTLTNTFQIGSAPVIETSDRKVLAYDLSFESVCIAYKAIFGVWLTDVYKIKMDGMNEQVLSLLALGCLISDINKWSNGFKSLETTLPALHIALNQRIFELLNKKEDSDDYRKRRKEFQLFGIGRTIPECFWRVRLLFRFMLGDIYHGTVDGLCRLTSLAYTWVGMQPEKNGDESLDPLPCILVDIPDYVMMTSPSPLHLIMKGDEYNQKGLESTISPETFKWCSQKSAATQKSYGLGADLSIQSFILQVLSDYTNGIPFDQPFECDVDVDTSILSLVPLKEGAKPSVENHRKNTIQKLKIYLYKKFEMVKQTDLDKAWLNATSEVKLKFFQRVNINSIGDTRPLLDSVIRFLLLGRVTEESYDPDCCFGKSLMALLNQLVESNGKLCMSAGIQLRSELRCINHPIDDDVIEGKKLEQRAQREELSANLLKEESIKKITLIDINDTGKIVSLVCIVFGPVNYFTTY